MSTPESSPLPSYIIPYKQPSADADAFTTACGIWEGLPAFNAFFDKLLLTGTIASWCRDKGINENTVTRVRGRIHAIDIRDLPRAGGLTHWQVVPRKQWLQAFSTVSGVSLEDLCLQNAEDLYARHCADVKRQADERRAVEGKKPVKANKKPAVVTTPVVVETPLTGQDLQSPLLEPGDYLFSVKERFPKWWKEVKDHVSGFWVEKLAAGLVPIRATDVEAAPGLIHLEIPSEVNVSSEGAKFIQTSKETAFQQLMGIKALPAEAWVPLLRDLRAEFNRRDDHDLEDLAPAAPKPQAAPAPAPKPAPVKPKPVLIAEPIQDNWDRLQLDFDDHIHTKAGSNPELLGFSTRIRALRQVARA